MATDISEVSWNLSINNTMRKEINDWAKEKKVYL